MPHTLMTIFHVEFFDGEVHREDFFADIMRAAEWMKTVEQYQATKHGNRNATIKTIQVDIRPLKMVEWWSEPSTD